MRMLRDRGKTLATAECGAAGLLAERLGGVNGWQDVFCGGWTLPKLTEPLDETAAHCREQFAADYGLAVGPLPPAGLNRDDKPATVGIALASSEGVDVLESHVAFHPALTRIFVVKQALNQVRLAMLA